MLSAPLRDRFGMNFRLDFYSDEELALVVEQKAKMLGILIDKDAALEIAKRSRMTARISIRILKRVVDLATVNDMDKITLDIVTETLELLDIDEHGLNYTDRSILKNLIQNFDNNPVGLGTLAASISEEPDTLETVYEPFLLKKGLIKRTSRGRLPTQRALDFYQNL
jgi:Holliday junction DNA helicase RuvB